MTAPPVSVVSEVRIGTWSPTRMEAVRLSSTIKVGDDTTLSLESVASRSSRTRASAPSNREKEAVGIRLSGVFRGRPLPSTPRSFWPPIELLKYHCRP
ncbi:hypothetical protein D3C84_772310 [compost metagenome]